jgi:hypothetical protein
MVGSRCGPIHAGIEGAEPSKGLAVGAQGLGGVVLAITEVIQEPIDQRVVRSIDWRWMRLLVLCGLAAHRNILVLCQALLKRQSLEMGLFTKWLADTL